MSLPVFCYEDIIRTALREDINYIDVTTDNLIPEEAVTGAVFLAKAEGILCGIDIAVQVLRTLDPSVEADIRLRDGAPVRPGDEIARVRGRTRALLKGERTALNLLQHLSGIATATRRAVEAVADTRARICDTRKTTPGLRVLEKYAVTVGGGQNHRFNLSDAALIKDNHADAVGSVGEAVRRLRAKAGHMVKIEAEARSLAEFRQALEAGADVIMLDNMDDGAMRQAVEEGRGRVPLEASGGITQERLHAVALTGVDLISVGALTHSARALDISMKIR